MRNTKYLEKHTNKKKKKKCFFKLTQSAYPFSGLLTAETDGVEYGALRGERPQTRVTSLELVLHEADGRLRVRCHHGCVCGQAGLVGLRSAMLDIAITPR